MIPKLHVTCKIAINKRTCIVLLAKKDNYNHLLTSLCCARFDAANLCRTLLNVTFVQSVHWLAHVQLDFAADVAPIDNDSMSGNVALLSI